MTRNKHEVLSLFGAGLLALTSMSCGDDALGDGMKPDPITEALAEQCGIDLNCESGLAEGNAAISGVASVDAFFQSVLNFQGRADMVASGIDAEIQAIGAAFGIEGDVGKVAAGLDAQIKANLEGGLKVVAEPARCEVDAQASVRASASCEGKVDPGKVEVDCSGSCEVEASADVKCSADAELKCTVTAPNVECKGSCSGSCTVMAMVAAACSGTCHGSCDGDCSLMNAEGQCEGQCSGKCMGSCEVAASADVMCMGTCNGECTVTKPMGGCEGGVRAECSAKANASVKCDGRCTGEVTPPMASVECQASAKAEASLNVECTPPRVEIVYAFKAGVSATAQAQFKAGITVLKARLPALLAAAGKAEVIGAAGIDLGEAGGKAVKGAATAAVKGESTLRVKLGVICAVKELDKVAATLHSSSAKLDASLAAAADITGAIGM
jgi:Polymer-forming cytoskeletal